MSNVFVQHRRFIDLFAFGCGVLCTVLACGVLIAHADLFHRKREQALSIGMQLPELESSVALLQANVEAEKLFFENGLVSREELADMYILPTSSPVPRFISSVNAIARSLSAVQSALTVERITVDASPTITDGVKSYHAHLTLKGSFQSVSRLLSVYALSGDMMVKDVLSSDTEQALLRAIESIAPLTLRLSEDFLYTDLLEYASHPDVIEQKMFADVPTETASELRSMLLHAGLAHARSSLSDIAKSLRDLRVWPLPLVSVTALQRDGDRWIVDCTVYGR